MKTVIEVHLPNYNEPVRVRVGSQVERLIGAFTAVLEKCLEEEEDEDSFLPPPAGLQRYPAKNPTRSVYIRPPGWENRPQRISWFDVGDWDPNGQDWLAHWDPLN